MPAEIEKKVKGEKNIHQIKKINVYCSLETVNEYLEHQKIMESSKLSLILPSLIYCTKNSIFLKYNICNNEYYPINSVAKIDDLENYVKGISFVLNGIHEYSLIHGNIKPNNVLISAKDCAVYLSDCFENEVRNLKDLSIEKKKYLSPEQLFDMEISRYSDYWSFCMLLFYLINGKSDLFNPNNDSELKQEINDFVVKKDKKQYLYSKLKVEKDGIDDYINVIDKMLNKGLTFKEVSGYISKPRNKLFNYNCLKYSVDNNMIVQKKVYEDNKNNIDVFNEILSEYVKTHKSNYFFCLLNFMWFNDKVFKTDNYFRQLPKGLPVIDYNDYSEESKESEDMNKLNTHYLGDFIRKHHSNINCYKLDISNLEDDDVFLLLVKNLRFVRYINYLNLSWNNYKIEHILDYLKYNFKYLDDLKELVCSDNRIGDDGVIFLSKHMRKMLEIDGTGRESINFSDCEMTIKGLKAICKNFNIVSSIHELFLDNNKLKDEGAEYLEKHCRVLTQLETLHLGCIYIYKSISIII